MSKRIEYMDALRGFAILTVVYQHLIVMGLSNTAYQSSVSKLIVLFFMPLFFFISGYFSLKIESINTLRELWCVYVKKIKTLLVPTIIMFSFCIFYFHLDFKHYIFEPNKKWILVYMGIVLYSSHVYGSKLCCHKFSFKSLLWGGNSPHIGGIATLGGATFGYE